MMGAIKDPPPTPVRPTSAPTPNPAAQFIQFIIISTLIVEARVGHRPDRHAWMPNMNCPIDLGASYYAYLAAVFG
ncbi:MAG: hypothetical protein WA807_00625 [Steroidobacteraceae bacterium]